MLFTLLNPCIDCPFRSNDLTKKGWLGRPRAKEIHDSLCNDGDFPCHKTLNYTDDDDNSRGRRTDKTIFCGGALIYLHKQGRLFDNRVTRAAAIFKLLNPDNLNLNASVFNSEKELLDFHSNNRR